MTQVAEIFLWFVIYSFFGWVYEEIICSIQAKKLLNRGFLSGPYCPIYGVGAICALPLTFYIESPALLFLAGATIASAIEYLTSYVMEKVFHARWWDYTHYPLNLNGRICLLGFLVFGFIVLCLPYMHTFVSGLTALLPGWLTIILAFLLAGIMLSDLITTTISVIKLNNSFKKYEDALQQNAFIRFIRAKRKSFHLEIEKQRKRRVLNYQQRRIFRNFNNFQTEYAKAYDAFRRKNLENMTRKKPEKHKP